MARKLYPDKWLFVATVGLALFGIEPAPIQTLQQGHYPLAHLAQLAICRLAPRDMWILPQLENRVSTGDADE